MKKAFTLVELLAVIVILGIIATITLPIIANNIEKSRKEIYRTNAQTALDAAKEYVSKNTINNDFPKGGIDITKLDIKNSNFKSGIVNKCPIKNYEGSDCEKRNIKPGEIYVKNIYNGKYCANGTKQNIIVSKVESEKDCELVDATGPELTLKLLRVTNDSILVSAYGYDSQTEILKYTFQIGNEEPVEIYTNKNIASYEFTNLEKIKKYNITVSVSNINALSEDEQYVKHPETHTTIDNTTLREVGLSEVGLPQFKVSGNNYASSKELTIIYPSIEGGENGYIVEDYDGNIISEIEVVEESIKFEINQNVKVIAYTKYGENKVENSINIFGIDDKGPEIEIIPMTDNWEKQKLVTVIVSDRGVGLSKRTCSFDGGNTWIDTKTRTINGEKKTVCEKLFSKNQVVDFKAKDKMGNISPIEGTTDKNSPYYIEVTRADSDPPNCTVLYDSPVNYNGEWTTQNVIVRAICDDKGLSGCEGDLSFNHTIEKNIMYEIGKVRDKVGNETVCKSVPVKIDRTVPNCNGIYGGKTNWTENQNVTIGAYCNDPFGECASNPFTTVISGEGKTQSATIAIRDKAGNSRNCTYTFNKYIDRTAPNCNGAYGGKTNWTKNQNVTVGAYCTDSLSGCSSNPFTTVISGEGKTQSATITIRDKVGHTRNCTYTFNKYIDTTNPTCSKGSGSGSSFTYWARCYDSLSGCTSPDYYSYSCSASVGYVTTCRAWYRFYDKAGNSVYCEQTVTADGGSAGGSCSSSLGISCSGNKCGVGAYDCGDCSVPSGVGFANDNVYRSWLKKCCENRPSAPQC